MRDVIIKKNLRTSREMRDTGDLDLYENEEQLMEKN